MPIINPPLNISEEDGDPSVFPYKVKYPDGSVTDNGDGTVSIAGGGGGAETDPIFSGSPAFGITGGQITNWDTAYGWGNHASAGYLTSIPAHAFTTLTDVPSSYAGMGGKVLAVKGDLSGLEFVSVGGGSGVTTLNTLDGDLSIVGTSNRVSVTASGTSITLTTPQDIDTAATPQFARLGLGVAAHATDQITGTGFKFSSLGQLTSSPIMKSTGYGLTLTPTFDNGSAAFQGLRVDVTDNASTGSSRVFYFGVGTNTFQMGSVGGALMQNLTLDTASPRSGFSQTITWNNSGYAYNAFLATITDTGSGVNSNIFRGVVDGVEKFAVRKDGRIVAPFYQFIGGTVSVFSAAVDSNKAALGGAFTFNNSAYTYHGVQVNLTNTASSQSSSLIYLYTDSALRMRQYADGRLYVETGTITASLGTTPVIRFSTTINQSGFTYHSFDVNSTHTASAVGSTLFRVLDGTDAKLTVNKFGSVICNSSALATNATDGFVYIPTTTGAPSGTPRAYTGRVAMHYDTANNKLWIYNGGWVSVTLA